MKYLSSLCLCLAVLGFAPQAHAAANPDTTAVVASNSAFACDLFAKLKGGPGNLFFSPYSISTAMAMTYGGARGETASQMAQALHLGLAPDKLHPAICAMQDELNAAGKQGNVKLAIANSLWPQKGHAFLPDYLTLCKSSYGVTITPVDFAGAAEKSRGQINAWVEDKTNNKIKGLFQPGTLDAMTRLVLVNAIYFKGTWATKFPKEQTRDAPFQLAAGGQKNMPMMHLESKLRYSETPDVQVLELPYAGRELSMLVMLPRAVDGMAALEKQINPANLTAWTRNLQTCKARVWLPCFKMESMFSLNQTLASLGITDAFDAKADFSGMDGTRDLFISKVVHKAFVDVNEEGTEAAAATGVAMQARSAPMKEREIDFRADHPFLFAIRANHDGSLLFFGRVNDPSK